MKSPYLLALVALPFVVAGCSDASAKRMHEQRTAAATRATSGAIAASPTSFAVRRRRRGRPARCQPAQLRISLTTIIGAAGTEHGSFDVRNRSRRSCRLYGYVGMQLLTAGGHALPTKLLRGPTAPDALSQRKQTIVLHPRKVAHFDLSWFAQCSSNQAEVPAKLKITPPDDRTSETVSARPAGKHKGKMVVCNGKLTVSPIFSRYRT